MIKPPKTIAHSFAVISFHFKQTRMTIMPDFQQQLTVLPENSPPPAKTAQIPDLLHLSPH
jgi:hypothetical protein